MKANAPKVTVALCTRDRAGMLRACLLSIVGQQLLPELRWQIVVVDYGSRGTTRKVVMEATAGARVPIGYLHEDRVGIAALALGKRASPQTIVRWIFVSSPLYLAIGIVAQACLEGVALASPGYRFAGSLRPNDQAVNWALMVISEMSFHAAKPGARAFRTVGFAVAPSLLLLTRSRTGIPCFALTALMSFWLRVSRRSKNLRVATFFLVVALASLVLLAEAFHPFLLSSLQLGRQEGGIDTLVGRISLWEHLVRFVGRKPLLGNGYGAFWTPARIVIVDVSKAMGWMVGQAHSDYPDVALQLGVVGLFGYVLVLLLGLCRALSLSLKCEDRFLPFAVAALTFCTPDGFMESQAYLTSFFAFVYMTLLVCLSVSSFSRRAIASSRRPMEDDAAVGGVGQAQV